MFTADTHFQIRGGSCGHHPQPCASSGQRHPGPRLERILGQDAFFHILDQEVAFGIITAVTKGHLGQVVGAEGEELGQLGNFTGGHSGARDFDHGAELVGEVDTSSRPSRPWQCASRRGWIHFSSLTVPVSGIMTSGFRFETVQWLSRRRLRRSRAPAFRRSRACRCSSGHRADPSSGCFRAWS